MEWLIDPDQFIIADDDPTGFGPKDCPPVKCKPSVTSCPPVGCRPAVAIYSTDV